jgi:uncharacterized protein YjbJ (UPF0337 family)
MNKDKIQGWTEEQIGKVKQKYARLGNTDFDLLSRGKEQEFIGKVRQAYGKSEEEVKQEWEAFKDACGCSSSPSKAA